MDAISFMDGLVALMQTLGLAFLVYGAALSIGEGLKLRGRPKRVVRTTRFPQPSHRRPA